LVNTRKKERKGKEQVNAEEGRKGGSRLDLKQERRIRTGGTLINIQKASKQREKLKKETLRITAW